ncbi:MAG: RHS repeat-associated core domain-containing protein [Bacteroidota bacterium]|nr:RHS repeat-associated core domain-containing protein [Bacteroidota bacterium]
MKYKHRDFENYDYGARFYDPQIGRWHTVDPLGEETSVISPYHYCYNNPVNYINPNGKKVEDKGDRNVITGDDIYTCLGYIETATEGPEYNENLYYALDQASKKNKGNGGAIESTLDEINVGSVLGGDSNSQSGGGEHGDGWYDPSSKANYSLGLIAEGMADLGHSSRLLKIGKVGGKATVGLGIVFDGIGVYNYYTKGSDNPNSVSLGKAAINTSFGIYGFWNPAAAIIYGGVDLFYPKGWEGCITDWQNSINPKNDPIIEQLMIQNAMSPF